MTIKERIEKGNLYSTNAMILSTSNPLDDCDPLVNEIYRGDFFEIPEKFLDYVYLDEGWSLENNCLSIHCYDPAEYPELKKEDPEEYGPADLIKEAAHQKQNFGKMSDLYDRMMQQFIYLYNRMRESMPDDFFYIRDMLTGLKHVLPRFLGIVLDYKMSLWPENIYLSIEKEIVDIQEYIQEVEPLDPGTQSIFDDYLDMLKYVLGKSEYSEAWYLFDENHALLDYFD